MDRLALAKDNGKQEMFMHHILSYQFTTVNNFSAVIGLAIKCLIG